MLEKDSCERVSEVCRAQDRFYDHNTTVSGIHQQMSKKGKTCKTKLLSLSTYYDTYLIFMFHSPQES